MKTIALAIQKGGTGKTVLSVSLAAALALKMPGQVLLIDCDPQGNASEWAAPERIQFELADVLMRRCPVEQAIVHATVPGLEVLPTAGLSGDLGTWAVGPGMLEPFALADLTSRIAGLGFSFCILDLSPGFSTVERAALVASDEVITPILPDPFGISGLELFTSNLHGLRTTLRTHNPAYRCIAINGVDHRISRHRTIVSQIQDGMTGFSFYVFPVDQVFSRAETAKQSIYQLGTAKKETLAAFDRLALELI
jgi:chromosome partitioning protein